MNEQEEENGLPAFNASYLIGKYEPALLQKIKTDETKQDEFVMYMDKGSRQYQKEQLIQQQKSKQQRQHENSPKRSR